MSVTPPPSLIYSLLRFCLPRVANLFLAPLLHDRFGLPTVLARPLYNFVYHLYITKDHWHIDNPLYLTLLRHRLCPSQTLNQAIAYKDGPSRPFLARPKTIEVVCYWIKNHRLTETQVLHLLAHLQAAELYSYFHTLIYLELVKSNILKSASWTALLNIRHTHPVTLYLLEHTKQDDKTRRLLLERLHCISLSRPEDPDYKSFLTLLGSLSPSEISYLASLHAYSSSAHFCGSWLMFTDRSVFALLLFKVALKTQNAEAIQSAFALLFETSSDRGWAFALLQTDPIINPYFSNLRSVLLTHPAREVRLGAIQYFGQLAQSTQAQAAPEPSLSR